MVSTVVRQQQPCVDSRTTAVQRQPCNRSSMVSTVVRQQQPCVDNHTTAVRRQPCNRSSMVSTAVRQQPQCVDSRTTAVRRQHRHQDFDNHATAVTFSAEQLAGLRSAAAQLPTVRPRTQRQPRHEPPCGVTTASPTGWPSFGSSATVQPRTQRQQRHELLPPSRRFSAA
jgi:hypothetical protein